MTLNGIPVLSYSIEEQRVSLVLAVDSMDAAMSNISDNMMLKDGVGNDFYAIIGYSNITRVAYLPSMSAYEVIVGRRMQSPDIPDAVAAQILWTAVNTDTLLEDEQNKEG